MTLKEIPVRFVMAGSQDPYEPAITKRTGISLRVILNLALEGPQIFWYRSLITGSW